MDSKEIPLGRILLVHRLTGETETLRRMHRIDGTIRLCAYDPDPEYGGWWSVFDSVDEASHAGFNCFFLGDA